MRWPWQKKLIQWKPNPEHLPHPRIIAQRPELSEADQNPHLRMILARAEIPIAPPALGAVILILPAILYPWFVLNLFNIQSNSIWNWILSGIGLWLYLMMLSGMQAHDTAPLSAGWCKKHFLPEKRDILLDYLTVGIKPETIVRALYALGLRRDLHSLQCSMLFVGITTAIPSYLLHRTHEVFWTRYAIMALAILNLGPLMWPTGMVALQVHRMAKVYKSSLDMRRRPFQYFSRIIIWLIFILTASIAAIIILFGLLIPVFGKTLMHWLDNGRIWIALLEMFKSISPLIFLPLYAALGIWYARFHLAREEFYLRKSAEIVAEILEWKREEFFERESRM